MSLRVLRWIVFSIAVLTTVTAGAGAGLANQPVPAAETGSRSARAQIDPSWEIAFVSERDGNAEIYVMNAGGGAAPRRLTTDLAADVHPSWSPNGERIAFVSERDGNAEIYVMNADGGAQQRLTNNPAFDGFPSWSPDGTRIAFVSERDGSPDIYVMNVDGGGVQRLTSDPNSDSLPAWKPGGSAIAFVAGRDGNGEIYVMDSSGASQQRLTTSFGANAMYPAWSPNGARISFTSERDGRGDLYVMDSSGEDFRRLNTQPDRVGKADWSPDGAWIAYLSDRDGNGELYAIAADGTSEVRLTDNPAEDFDPDWRPLQLAACQVRTDREDVEVRVGPGPNRGVFTSMPRDQLFMVIGQAQAEDESLWWELDKTQFPNHEQVTSLWVAQDDVEEIGACGVVPPSEPPPIIIPQPGTTPGSWGPCGSCDTCGYDPSECVLSPTGECVWDPTTCRPDIPPPGITPEIPPPPDEEPECYTVTVSGTPGGWGSVAIRTPPNCGRSQYLMGTSVTVYASVSDPQQYWVESWSGTCGGANQDVAGTPPTSAINVTVNGNCSVVALFATLE